MEEEPDTLSATEAAAVAEVQSAVSETLSHYCCCIVCPGR